MSPGPTFDRVYLALKEQLVKGRFAPGEHLEPVLIGEELHASITPVRDALHRLAGERLVESPRHDGFRVPLLTEFALRHLYGFANDLLLLALKAPRARPAGHEGDGDAAISLFLSIGALSANPEHVDAIALVGARLGPATIAELLVLDEIPDELEGMRASLASLDLGSLRRAVLAYHRRRIRYAPLILEAMHRHPAGE